MNLFSLSLRDLRFSPHSAILAASLSALSVALLTVLLGVSRQLSARIERDARGIDLVVGAKGSPLQLVLSGVYQVDVPTGNIPLGEVEALARNPLVERAVPLAMGDSYRGSRIIGAPLSYLALYGAHLSDGRAYARPLEVTLGAECAHRLGLKLGDRFVGSHGLAEGGHVHADMQYEVVGLLAPTGSVIDRLILTPLESVWQVHAERAEHAELTQRHDAAREVTMALIRYASPLAAATLPRWIDQRSTLQAASPAFELARLTQLIGVGREALQGLSMLLLAMASAALLLGLIANFRSRQYELAVFRMLGASPRQLFGSILLEGWLIATVGASAGILSGHGALAILATWLTHQGRPSLDALAFHPEEAGTLALTWLVSLLAAVWPAWQAYRLDVGTTFAKG